MHIEFIKPNVLNSTKLLFHSSVRTHQDIETKNKKARSAI